MMPNLAVKRGAVGAPLDCEVRLVRKPENVNLRKASHNTPELKLPKTVT
jgi:hypothetical protein